jgi:hypothetical protein
MKLSPSLPRSAIGGAEIEQQVLDARLLATKVDQHLAADREYDDGYRHHVERGEEQRKAALASGPSGGSSAGRASAS